MSYFFREALNSDRLMDAYLARPPYQQNDYIGWVMRAKLENTKTQSDVGRTKTRQRLYENEMERIKQGRAFARLFFCMAK
jgi:hypothetical protein